MKDANCTWTFAEPEYNRVWMRVSVLQTDKDNSTDCQNYLMVYLRIQLYFHGSCFMYIYTIYWLKQTLPLIMFVKISKISCFYFSMVLYFKTVYFPLISKIYNRKQTQGFDVAMGTIYFDQGIAFVNKLTSNVTFNLLFWSQRSLTMSDLSFLFGVYLKLEEIKDNKRHLLKRYCNPVARDYVKSNFNQILVTANNIKFKISWNGSFK